MMVQSKAAARLAPIAIVVAMAGANVAEAQEFSGNVEGGFIGSSRQSTQESDEFIENGPLGGQYLAGQVQVDYNAFRFSMNARLEDFGDRKGLDEEETGPMHTGILGIHAGRNFGPTYVGAFYARGLFDGFDDEKGMGGDLLGVEASYDINPASTVFAQLAVIEAIGDPDDNEMVGNVARVGTTTQISDRTNLGAAFEYGFSEDCFVDCGDEPGEFTSLTIDGAYAITAAVDLTAGMVLTTVTDFDDPDEGWDTSFFVGARYNFGDQGQGKALTAPMGGFRAAGWMDPLD